MATFYTVDCIFLCMITTWPSELTCLINRSIILQAVSPVVYELRIVFRFIVSPPTLKIKRQELTRGRNALLEGYSLLSFNSAHCCG